MSEKKEEYPVSGLHAFLDEASKEFRRYRFQATINLIGSIVVLLFFGRFFFFLFANFGPPPFEARPPFRERPPAFFPFVPDLILLVASLVFLVFSLYAFIKQRRFVSRWGERFEKLEALEKKYLPDESPS